MHAQRKTTAIVKNLECLKIHTSSRVDLPSGILTVRVRNAAPTVALDEGSKRPRQNRRARHDLPTPCEWRGGVMRE